VTPNLRRGLKRLAIAIAVPWFGWWAFWGWAGYRNYSYASEHMAEALRKQDGFWINFYSQMNIDSMQMMGSAVVYGVGLPIVALIVIAVAYWVYRGFKPKEKPE